MENLTDFDEALMRLMEECAEVTQVCSKIFRFGWTSYHPDEPDVINRHLLEMELGHVLANMKVLADRGYISMDMVELEKNFKLEKLLERN